MAENSKIGWTDSTVNFWSGCTKVSSGCAHCYAETMDNRHLIEKVSHWGKNAPRLKSVGAVKLAHKLNREFLICDHCGVGQAGAVTMDEGCVNHQCPSHDLESAKCSYHRRRIFSLSRGDWLDDEVAIEWLAEMLATIQECDQVVWILCTKRPENFRLRLELACQWICGQQQSEKWIGTHQFIYEWLKGNLGAIANIILLTSVENQATADKRIPELLKIPAACRGLSLEPLLEAVDLSNFVTDFYVRLSQPDGEPEQIQCPPTMDGISWLIIGCESGSKRRECKLEWVSSLVKQGESNGIATFVKQLQDSEGMVCTDVKEFPADLQIQNWPK